ncbi:hypothetical protein BD626DRAFT_570373 [Schizophyllum amplum]|uniref:C2H2-type domain-containing protein n=1 Tax=Schizophyllum amplum TaxID=97359 RepID=A0A550CBH7_9AGAR|nr:hypothetical protein BD626DRAFT_570373 [Auriculariopsis ampla]
MAAVRLVTIESLATSASPTRQITPPLPEQEPAAELDVIYDKDDVERPYICPYCPLRCPQKNTVKIHIRARHTKERKHQCPSCAYNTADPSCLNKHRKRKHGWVPKSKRGGGGVSRRASPMPAPPPPQTQMQSLPPQMPASTSRLPPSTSQVPSSIPYTPSRIPQRPYATKQRPYYAASQVPHPTLHMPHPALHKPSPTPRPPSPSPSPRSTSGSATDYEQSLYYRPRLSGSRMHAQNLQRPRLTIIEATSVPLLAPAVWTDPDDSDAESDSVPPIAFLPSFRMDTSR